MFKKLATLLAGAALLLATSSAMATTIGLTPSTSQLQGVLDGITASGTSFVNAATDMISDGNDAYWKVTASNGSVASMVIELGGYAPNNKLYVYDSTDPTGNTRLLLFDGAAVQGNKVTLTIDAAGHFEVIGKDINGLFDRTATFGSTTFGYLLDSSYYEGGGSFFSDSTLNEQVDGNYVNHMLAYQGKGDQVVIYPGAAQGTWTSNEYILGFEDLNASIYSDFNFTDMVVMVESVEPVPEPGTMVLLGAGMLGLAIFGKRRMNRES